MSASSSRSNSSSSSPFTVTKLRMMLDPDKDLIIEFETDDDKFCIIVILHDNQNLGWKEVEAVVTCLQWVVPGQCSMTSDMFQQHSVSLARRFGKVNGPLRLDNGTLSTALMPSSRGAIENNKHDTLLQTCLLFKDDENAFYFISGVRDTLYKVKLSLSSSAPLSFNRADTIVFICVLTLLEPGDALGEDAFVAAMKQVMHKSDYLMNIEDDWENDVKVISVSFKQNTKELSRNDIFHAMGQSMLSSLSVTTTIGPSQAGAGVDTVTPSPYPGIEYRRALKQSGQAQVYDAVRVTGRHSGGDRPDGVSIASRSSRESRASSTTSIGRSETRVAVKVFTDGANQLDTYKAELKGLLGMKQHENIVKIYDFFETPKPALIMQYVDGKDLCDYLAEHGAMSQREGLELCIGIAKGLKHLHDHKIIHRDLKSANVLRRTADGSPVIIDLGLSNILHGTAMGDSSNGATMSVRLSKAQQKTECAKGTLMWMPPEMIMAKEWSDRTDVYAFGILMWEIFSGEVPFLSEMDSSTLTPTALLVAISRGRRPSLDRLKAKGIEKWLCTLIEQCWDATPANRPSMNTVLRKLQFADPRAVFDELSVARSGALNFPEFAAFLEKYMPGKVAPGNMHPFFQAVNISKSGSLDFEEFTHLWKYVSKKMGH